MAAQLNHPKASPLTTIEQEVGLTSIKVTYSRPATRGRKIFYDLVPLDRIWRVGANASTKITLNSTVQMLNDTLPKGTYALYAFPQKEIWEIVFHGNTGHWGDGRKNYDPKEDVLRIKVKPQTIPIFQENFVITFDQIDHNSLFMVWRWEYTEIRIPIKIETHRLMETQITTKLEDNPTAQTYYEAARYYQEQGTNYNTSLHYLNKAIELGGDTYYFYRVKSLVEASLTNYKAAIKSAERSLVLANLEDKDEFVRMNEKNIRKWKNMLKEPK